MHGPIFSHHVHPATVEVITPSRTLVDVRREPAARGSEGNV
jgi:hypothetical protein